MAGFGAGFARALGTSLDAAGKSHLEEQRRAREYERAKADRQAERLEDRAWQLEDAATARTQQLEDQKRAQDIKDEDNPLRTFYDPKQKKWFFQTRSGDLVEQSEDSVLVQARKRTDIKFAEDRESHNSEIRARNASIAASSEAAATSRFQREQARAKAGQLNVFAELAPSQRAIVQSIAKFGPYANVSDGKGNMIPVTKDMVEAARALESSKNPAAAYQAASDLKDLLNNAVIGPAPSRKDGEPDTRAFANTPPRPVSRATQAAQIPGWSLNSYKK